MTVTFFSSILNHHQLSFCEEMIKIPDVEFTFVQMIDLTEERRAQGFRAYDMPYVVSAQKDPERAHSLCIESDVVIAGVIRQDWANERVSQGKLTFAYRERFLKNKRGIFSPAFWKNGYQNFYKFRDKELYFLCASAYTAKDTRIIFPRPQKKFKWGYFPMLNTYEDFDGVIAQKKPHTILWVGRFLAWKHPESCITLARHLVDEGLDFSLSLIGLGEMEEELKAMIAKYDLSDRVTLLGQMSPEAVKQKMRESDVFLFTSDRGEGWGAVLNEAMSEGCACIASKQAGSTNFLIRDGENGYAFDYNDMKLLLSRTKLLLTHPQEKQAMQKSALQTIGGEWNAKEAANRLTEFCRCKLKDAQPPQYANGPMSVCD